MSKGRRRRRGLWHRSRRCHLGRWPGGSRPRRRCRRHLRRLLLTAQLCAERLADLRADQMRRGPLGLGPGEVCCIGGLALLLQFPGDAAFKGLLVNGAIVQQAKARPDSGPSAPGE